MEQELKVERTWFGRTGGGINQKCEWRRKMGLGWSRGHILTAVSLKGVQKWCVYVRWQSCGKFAMIKMQRRRRESRKIIIMFGELDMWKHFFGKLVSLLPSLSHKFGLLKEFRDHSWLLVINKDIINNMYTT